MKVRSNEQRRNTYNFLMEVYNLTSENYTKVAMNDLLGSHKIARGTATTLFINKFILKKADGHHRLYKWNSIQPNYKMVEKILDLNLEYSRMHHEARKNANNKIKEEAEEALIISDTSVTFTPKTRKSKVVEVEKKQKSFSFFWGLIKINY